MAYNTLKAAIIAAIRNNDNEEITGDILQGVLLSIVNSVGSGYNFAGVATPSTNPGTPDGSMYWIGGKGTYTNFGSTITVPAGFLGLFMWDGSAFSRQAIKLSGGDGIFDVTDYTGNRYASLSAALAAVPQEVMSGGMTIRFVKSPDNKYMQYRYMGTATTGEPNPFLDTANWQGVDDKPTAGSNNLVKSGGVFEEISDIVGRKTVSESSVSNWHTYFVFNAVAGKKYVFNIHCDAVSSTKYFGFGSGSGQLDFVIETIPDGQSSGSVEITPSTSRTIYVNSFGGMTNVVAELISEGVNLISINKRLEDAEQDITDLQENKADKTLVEHELITVEQDIADLQENKANKAQFENALTIIDFAKYLGVTQSAINKFSFYGEFPATFSNADCIPNLLPGKSGNLLSIRWAEERYIQVDGGNPIPELGNTELYWAKTVNYGELLRCDFSNVFVRYNDSAPYSIEAIAIAPDDAVFSDFEYSLIAKSFRLPLFNRGTLNANGVVKGNKPLCRVEYNNLISNPVFSSSSDWELGTAWSISGGQAICNDSSGTQGSLRKTNLGLTVGKQYKLSFRVDDYVSGGLEARINWNVAVSKTAVYNYLYEMTFTYAAGAGEHNQELLLRPITGGFVGNIVFVELVEL